MSTRDYLLVWINGQRHEVRGGDAFLSLSDFLRHRLRLVGTKIVCSEGDCGACSVLVGRPEGDQIAYRAIDACIVFLFQLDSAHVVTVEGLANGQLTSVQQAMVECHGSQCGFCTPGFVMAMHGHCETSTRFDEPDWRQALTGNLCRCTGYTPILAAAEQAQKRGCSPIAERYPPAPLLADFGRHDERLVEITDGDRAVCCPSTLNSAIDWLAQYPDAKVIAGATDVGVQLNKRRIAPQEILCLTRIESLRRVELADGSDGEHVLSVGALVTWTELEPMIANVLPQLSEILSRFGGPQIRHMGTLGGNLINASPIADSIPLLYVLDAELIIQGLDDERRVNINNFYQGYKKYDLAAGELLLQVMIPLPRADDRLRLYKVSRRRDLDIATFTAAIRLHVEDEIIIEARIAYGAVGPTVLRLPETEEFLIGEPFNEETMRTAGEIAVGEITPISDVRGSADYRRQLARNVLVKFFHEETRASGLAPAYN